VTPRESKLFTILLVLIVALLGLDVIGRHLLRVEYARECCGDYFTEFKREAEAETKNAPLRGEWPDQAKDGDVPIVETWLANQKDLAGFKITGWSFCQSHRQYWRVSARLSAPAPNPLDVHLDKTFFIQKKQIVAVRDAKCYAIGGRIR
jgi:hypothetical protein